MSLRFGDVTLGTPVVLAPMAGVTNPPFRRLCRVAGLAGLPETPAVAAAAASGPIAASAASGRGPTGPSGLYVTEMITSRALVERTPETMRMITPEEGDPVRSVQLYGVDPDTIAAATRILVEEEWADHVDLNFGCPVPKVTRKGGGAALPWKKDLFRDIVAAAVGAAERASRTRSHTVPVSVKMRMGVDDSHLTYLEAGRAAANAGVAAVALHARTAAQHYSGQARWEAITRLREELPAETPVLGNGDIWSAEDALRMVAETGCEGVVVGRGCQGRPWLFTDLVAAFHGSPARVRPALGEVAAVIREHAELMVEHFGDEGRALRELRKHMAWYLKGYPVGGEARRRLGLVESLQDLDLKLSELDLDAPYPGEVAEGQRGRAGSPKQPHLPDGWLDNPYLDTAERVTVAAAELDVSGG
ncbi:MAG TPA: tRNA dihydrouridine synthase DusB [Actinomycetaceae bacterium]|nr:tRNA dihydrouridine synthase DusB [Actinomycetaceae bacterium]